MKKNVVNLQPEDALYKISMRVAELQAEKAEIEEELELLRVKGAKIMTRNKWTHATCPRFTSFLMTHYRGLNWEKIKALPGYRSYRCTLPMETPKMNVTMKKG